MDCRDFDRALEALRGTDGSGEELGEHAGGCARCGRRLGRYRLLSSVLGDLRLESAPPDLDARVLAAAGSMRPASGVPRILLRAAAALLLLLGGLAAVLGLSSREPDYVPLQLRVVVEDADALEEDLALEFIYGPEETSLFAGGGESDAPEDR